MFVLSIYGNTNLKIARIARYSKTDLYMRAKILFIYRNTPT